jgi:hypothetical protein
MYRECRSVTVYNVGTVGYTQVAAIRARMHK